MAMPSPANASEGRLVDAHLFSSNTASTSSTSSVAMSSPNSTAEARPARAACSVLEMDHRRHCRLPALAAPPVFCAFLVTSPSAAMVNGLRNVSYFK